jgi:diacylglycerol kinase family enzyme
MTQGIGPDSGLLRYGNADGNGNGNDHQRRGDGESQRLAADVFRERPTGVRTREWVGIAANRGAGVGKGRAKVARLVYELRRLGLRPRIAWTPQERSTLAAESADDPRARCLVAVGGDGTVAAVLNECPKVPITVLPCGTENLFARHFRIGSSPVKLAATIARGEVIRTDLGLTRGRRFSLMAGFGFDGDVVTRHHIARVGPSGVPRPTNRAAYFDPILRSSFDYRFHNMSVRVEDPGAEETLVGSTVFVFNLPRYALGLPFAPAARGDDGYLDLVVFREPGAFHALHYLWLVIRGLHLRRPGVEHRRVRRVVVSSAERIPVQLDGDPGGFLEAGPGQGWEVEVLPDAVDVLVPAAGR